MGDVVYARFDTRVVWDGGMSPISLGEVWDSEAPLVKARPDLFSTTPTRVRGRQPRPADTEGQAVDKPRRRRSSP